MDIGIKDEIKNKICSVFSKYSEIEKVILYGSRAKGDFKICSDIDLVLLGNELSLSLLYKILDDIDNLLLPYSFDISIFDKISNKNLLEHINRVGKIFYSKN